MDPPHGTKRAADGALDGEQRLSKRFDLLKLDLDHTNRAARLSIPRPTASHPAAAPPTPTRPPPAHDAMHLEDTPHRVYIHDLAAELSDADSDSDHPIFLPDIEKHLSRSRIPPHLLMLPAPTSTHHNQLVLYNLPASLTLPEEHDSVRKAIGEARQRLRESQASGQTVPRQTRQTRQTQTREKPVRTATATHEAGDDADAMDLD